MDVQRVLSLIRAPLERDAIPVALAGAFAINAYGMGRATADLDLVAPLRAQPLLVSTLESHGYETLYRSDGFSNHLHKDAALGRVDFIYVDDATAQKLFPPSHTMTIAGVGTVLVPRVEHLIAMKVQAIKNNYARRHKDLADIQHLLSQPGVDKEEARQYFERAGMQEDWNGLSNRKA